MEIKLQIRGRVYSLCIGRETKWFEQSSLFVLIEEDYDEFKQVTYATVLLKS